MVSSFTSFAPASIITTFSPVAASVRFKSLRLRSCKVGFKTISPSTNPTETPPIGPLNGISETETAMEAASNAHISGEQSGSTDNTVVTIDTSLRMSLGKSGLIGRSIQREVNTAFSEGFPSLFIKEPGILPTEYNRSS